MKATGIVRKVDELGRIVIPKELRQTMDLPEGAPVEIFTEENTIVLRKYAPGCVFCGETEDVTEYRGRRVCKACCEGLYHGSAT